MYRRFFRLFLRLLRVSVVRNPLMPYWPSSVARHASRLTKRILRVLLLGWSTAALAGGGPESVLLVVNPRSTASLTIANHYARLRQIPPDNLLYLPWQPDAQTTDINTFRRQILVPVLQTIEQRRLTEQIDYVVYSSDFPWGINLDGDIRKLFESLPSPSPQGGNGATAAEKAKTAPKPEWPKILTPVGSLNGLTYLWQAAAGRSLAYFNLQGNRYMRLPIPSRTAEPARASAATASTVRRAKWSPRAGSGTSSR